MLLEVFEMVFSYVGRDCMKLNFHVGEDSLCMSEATHEVVLHTLVHLVQ